MSSLPHAQRRQGPTAAIRPLRRRSSLTAVSGWKLDLLVRDFARFINSEVALLYQTGSERERPAVISSWGLGATHDEVARPDAGGFVGRALLRAQRVALGPLDPLLDSSLMQARHPPITHAVAVPIRLATEVGGHLVAGFAAAPRDPTLTVWSAESFAALIALCLHDPRALDGLISAVRRDALTGCLNYEGTLRELDREINRSSRGGLELSVCFIDLDSFKRVNDEHGHLRGNEVLALAGRILREAVRSCDTVGRYGGDEFIVLLPETSEAQARQLAERLRSRLANTAIASLDHRLTASVGTAQWIPGSSSEALLAAADGALLAAKARRSGSSDGASNGRDSSERHALG